MDERVRTMSVEPVGPVGDLVRLASSPVQDVWTISAQHQVSYTIQAIMQRKNIVLLIADDLGKYIGAYGCESVSTPAIDALAKRGIRFDLAFASTASCSGSRSTIYTGLHTHENGQYGLNQFKAHFQSM